MQEVAAIHNVLLDIGIDPAVPILLGAADHGLKAESVFSSICKIEFAGVCPVVPHVLVDHPFDQPVRRFLIEIAVGRGVVVVGAGQCVGGESELKLIGVEAHVVNGIELTHQGKIPVELVRYVDHVAHVAHLFGG